MDEGLLSLKTSRASLPKATFPADGYCSGSGSDSSNPDSSAKYFWTCASALPSKVPQSAKPSNILRTSPLKSFIPAHSAPCVLH
eukprot:1189474-Pyramimonas_sp.AAC.1